MMATVGDVVVTQTPNGTRVEKADPHSRIAAGLLRNPDVLDDIVARVVMLMVVPVEAVVIA